MLAFLNVFLEISLARAKYEQKESCVTAVLRMDLNSYKSNGKERVTQWNKK